MPVTAKEIADKLGLSQPTVSRILKGTFGYRVAAETRERVLAAARELDYRPNAVARSLRQRRTNIVGFYSGYATLDARHDFIGALVGGLQAACETRNLDLLLHGGHRDREPEVVYRELVDGRVDGLFFHGAIDNPLISLLATSHLPVIALVDRMEGIPSVVADNTMGMRALLRSLWLKGHRRIAFLRPAIRFTSVELRVGAFIEVMADLGALVDESPIITTAIEGGESTVDDILGHPMRPTAVCCWNDRAAYNLLWHCMKRGVDVPGDLAIAGFDGFLETKLPLRHLSTVSVPYGILTDLAMTLMTRLVAGQTVPDETRVSVDLVIGDTT